MHIPTGKKMEAMPHLEELEELACYSYLHECDSVNQHTDDFSCLIETFCALRNTQGSVSLPTSRKIDLWIDEITNQFF